MKDDGGPAFPIPESDEFNPCDGMSLRDYFAAQAMAGILASAEEVADRDLGPGASRAAVIASQAYFIADAMLKQRVVRGGVEDTQG